MVPNLQVLETNLTFHVVLQFETCLHLDNFSSSFLLQKCNFGFKNVNLKNNDILYYLFFDLYPKLYRPSTLNIQMKLILLWVWAEQAVLGRAKTALKFKNEI